VFVSAELSVFVTSEQLTTNSAAAKMKTVAKIVLFMIADLWFKKDLGLCRAKSISGLSPVF
jgi:hypothetical protein